MTTITIDRAVVEQALEALENLSAYDSRPSSIWRSFYPSATGDYVNLREFKEMAEPTIAALRAALAQPQHPPVTKGLQRKLPEDNDHGDWDRIDALEASLREHMAEIHRLRAALAQPSPATLFDPRGSLGEPIV